jgi:hypothetical protein
MLVIGLGYAWYEDSYLQTQDLKTQEIELSELAADKKDDEVVDKAHDWILDRQFDMKYVIQLIQDIELVKRVVFQERH